MAQKLISICIPTYNRATFLQECLESITAQFSDQKIRDEVNVFILDNQSIDNTKEISDKFINLFDNVKYIRDSKNRKIAPGIIEAASLADGKYIWVFSDDDLQTNNTLKFIIDAININQPDLIISNLNSFFGKLEKIGLNLLKINQDFIFNNRKDFFKYLNSKTFSNLDFYTTFCSNFILNKKIFDNNRNILEKFNGPLDVFPFHSIVFYSNKDLLIKVISEPTLFIRGDNESWGSRNKIKHYFYRSKLWRYHYKNITNINRDYLPLLFPIKIRIKNFLEIRSLLNFLLITFLKKNLFIQDN